MFVRLGQEIQALSRSEALNGQSSNVLEVCERAYKNRGFSIVPCIHYAKYKMACDPDDLFLGSSMVRISTATTRRWRTRRLPIAKCNYRSRLCNPVDIPSIGRDKQPVMYER
jgi:hypothetical protein